MFAILLILIWELKKSNQQNKKTLILGVEAPVADQHSGFRKISGKASLFLSLSLSFWKKGIVFKCFLCMSWLLDSLDLPSRRKVTHKLMSRVDYGFNHCSVVSLLSRNFMSTYWWWSSVYLVILMYFMQINFHLLWSANKFTDFVVFLNFLLTLHATWIIKKSKILRIFKESK